MKNLLLTLTLLISFTSCQKEVKIGTKCPFDRVCNQTLYNGEHIDYYDAIFSWAWFKNQRKIVAITNYKDGLIHGTQKVYSTSGNINRKVNFIAGERHGESITYYDDLGFKYVIPYKRAIENMQRRFNVFTSLIQTYSNGNLIQSESYAKPETGSEIMAGKGKLEEIKTYDEVIQPTPTVATEPQAKVKKVIQPPNTFRITTKDFYIDKFGKNPDYGNSIDVSSSYFTNRILYSRTTEVLDERNNKRYGKLYEGLSYVERGFENGKNISWVDYSNRAELNFYIGNYKKALNDFDKYISLVKDDDEWMYFVSFKFRSKIKYMLGDLTGAINDLEKHYNYFIKKDPNCLIESYYWFSVYYLATNDYSKADYFLGKINSYPVSNEWCGGSVINNVKSKSNMLVKYIKL